MTVPQLPRWVARRRVGGALMFLLGCLVVCGPLAGAARASTSASAAAAFIESAQNSDGGFSASYGGPTRSGGRSDPTASLWATLALLAAGKNPVDEALNNGRSAQDYLSAHLSAFRSLTDFGLLGLIEAGSGANATLYGSPATALKTDLSAARIAADPAGAALGVLGLEALHDADAARSAATALLGDQATDGGWAESGTDPSAATALVLQAMAATGVSSSASGAAAVKAAVGYIAGAQINDGSIAQSDASATAGSGDVAATAFTVQALAALHYGALRTSTGVSVLAGLANYQQASGNGKGGLSPYGAYDTGVAASVIQTAQAYPAFDGMTFPLPYVAPTPPPTVTTTPAAASTAVTSPVNRASAGTSTSGVSAAGTGPKRSAGAYQGASAAGKIGAKPTAKHASVAASSGQQVTGSVVSATPPPKLTSAAGRPPAKDHSALYLTLGLVLVALAGGLMETRRPRRRGDSAVRAGVAATDRFGRWFVRRGSSLPVTAALLGVALILIPVVSGMWSRAPRGAAMIRAFRPYMAPAHLDRLVSEVTVMQRAVAETAKTAAVKSFATTQWPRIDRHFSGTLDTVSAQRGHFRALASLPSFRAFPWFLLIPGVLLLGLALVALWRPGLWPRLRWAVAALGLALVISPLALGLFSAGSQGASLVSAFSRVETRPNVTAMQNGFSDLVIGESAVTGTATGSAADHYPAAAAFATRWPTILEDFTPLLGVMSDNVDNYRAVAALPDFRSFPWLFAIPGLLALLIALIGAPRGLRLRRLRAPAAISHPTPRQGATDAT